MERNHLDQKIQFLKRDGSDLFAEGDITGATDMYIDAMELEMEQDVQRLTSTKQRLPSNDDSSEEFSRNKPNKGINSVICAVIDDAEEAIQANPSLPKPYLAKATALLLQNKWEDAREVYMDGVKSCENCEEIRQALQKFQKTEALLQSIPSILERTRPISSDTGEGTLEGRSLIFKSRRFRLQHRKKLSRPMVSYAMTKSPGIFRLTEAEEANTLNDQDNAHCSAAADTTSSSEN